MVQGPVKPKFIDTAWVSRNLERGSPPDGGAKIFLYICSRRAWSHVLSRMRLGKVAAHVSKTVHVYRSDRKVGDGRLRCFLCIRA